jgi:hypothetical protein
MAHYRTGTISLTNGSTSVTGSGTDFVAGAAVGECLSAPDGKLYEIAAIVSATAITLGTVYLGTTASGQAYSIVPTQSYLRDLAASAAALVNTYSDSNTNILAGRFAVGAVATPGMTFVGFTNVGFYHASSALNVTYGGVFQAKFDAAGLTVADNKFTVVGSSDATKKAVFEVDGFTTATTRTFTLPNFNGTLATLAGTETLTNKTLTSPTITGGVLNGTVGATTPSTGAFTTITASTSITENTYAVFSQYDVGTASNQVPLNQNLGALAFLDTVPSITPASTDPTNNKDINFQYVSDTSIKIRMRGTDGVVRSTTLTLA